VIIADQPSSVIDYARTLGVDVPVLLRSLRSRGLNFASNSRIDLPVMRSLAFEFKCYPAKDEDEHAALSTDENDGESEEEQEAYPPAESAASTISTRPIHSSKPLLAERPALPPGSRIETAKRKALDLFSAENKPTNKRTTAPPSEVFGSLSKILDQKLSPKDDGPGQFSAAASLGDFSNQIPVGDPDDLKLIIIKPPILVPELAAKLGLKPFNVMAALIKLSVFPAPNQPLDPAVAEKICKMHGFTFKTKNRP
jgi:hypothetical protein